MTTATEPATTRECPARRLPYQWSATSATCSVLALAGAVVSLFRGGVYIHDEIAQKAGNAAHSDEAIEGDGAAGEVLDVDGDDGAETARRDGHAEADRSSTHA